MNIKHRYGGGERDQAEGAGAGEGGAQEADGQRETLGVSETKG